MTRFTIRTFLAQAKKHLQTAPARATSSKTSFVVGNESAALDSIACALLVALGRWSGPPPGGMVDSASLALAFWCGVAVFEALWFPAALGALLYAALLVRRSRMGRRAGGVNSGVDRERRLL